MNIEEDKIEQLKSGLLTEEQRQEMIYEILKRQLEIARKELHEIRLKKKQQRASSNSPNLRKSLHENSQENRKAAMEEARRSLLMRNILERKKRR